MAAKPVGSTTAAATSTAARRCDDPFNNECEDMASQRCTDESCAARYLCLDCDTSYHKKKILAGHVRVKIKSGNCSYQLQIPTHRVFVCHRG
jgi:hypothetical protein